ncbi:Arylsulfatase [Rubripirellula tenax]|uniref:Arylsulfatase n=1 Tax=Rubripirellula tenax TaxID=2528015 RepID=A0A5C6F4N4_9BACT|nr:sulfatase [Rubripirellula tenax]TWU56703.1 Arylsulfatase [Rubripirellula tenax]
MNHHQMFRWISPLLALFGMACISNAVEATTKPNIILIFTDDQGYQDLGCFGSETIKTPNLDRMAAEGVRLTDFYAQPVCGVSRAALMTGSYPIRVAEPGNIKRLHTVPHPKETTMAEVLKSAGYATGIIGKWHLGLARADATGGIDPATAPNAQGFDHFYGTPIYNGHTVYVDDVKMRVPLLRNGNVEVDGVQSWDNITSDYTHEAIEWITAKSTEHKPFFLYLSHNMPHIPLGASANFKGKSDGGPYGDAIEEIDWSCGQIMKTLKDLSIDDNTLVVFTSDNGPWVETTRGMDPNGKAFIPRDHSGNTDPLRGWKMSAWEGGCRVPFIARWPGNIPAGWDSNELLSTMDLLPTFATIAGATLPDAALDGSDATAFLTRQTTTSPRDEYLYYSGCLLTGVRRGNWKLVLTRAKNPSGTGWWGRMIEAVPETMLFDLASDPGETTNVANANANVVGELMKRIEIARAELGDIDQIGNGARLFDDGPRKLQVPVKKTSDEAATAKVRHSFMAFGKQTYLVDGEGTKTWSFPESTRDGYQLADGRIILALSKGKRFPGGAVIEIAVDGSETMIWKGTQSEVNSVHPTDAGTFVITEAGPKPRLLELDRSGQVLIEFPLKCQIENHHLQTRMARKLADGTYLVPHLLDFRVKNYDASGNVIAELDTTVPGDEAHAIHSWPFTAIRHDDGRTLVCCTNGNRVMDFDANGKLDWHLTNDDLPGPWLQDPCGGQVLANGNVVIACYAGGNKNPKAPKLFEITRDKKVVWTHRDGQKVGIHHFQILTTNGKRLPGVPMK